MKQGQQKRGEGDFHNDIQSASSPVNKEGWVSVDDHAKNDMVSARKNLPRRAYDIRESIANSLQRSPYKPAEN